MQIILWRHAEADDNYHRDLSRELTPRGHRHAKQTAQYLSKPLIDARFNPGSRVKHVEGALKSLLDIHARPIVLVAHQPFLGQVASLFVRCDCMSQPVKKSAIYWLKSL